MSLSVERMVGWW